MKSIQEQIASKCIHFTGLGNETCDIGIRYDDVKIPNVRPFKIPCLKDSLLSGGSCEKVCFPSDEEVEKEVAKIEEESDRVTSIIIKAKEHYKNTDETEGCVECPSCKGKLFYNISTSNGHTWGNCKCGFGWME